MRLENPTILYGSARSRGHCANVVVSSALNPRQARPRWTGLASISRSGSALAGVRSGSALAGVASASHRSAGPPAGCGG